MDLVESAQREAIWLVLLIVLADIPFSGSLGKETAVGRNADVCAQPAP